MNSWKTFNKEYTWGEWKMIFTAGVATVLCFGSGILFERIAVRYICSDMLIEIVRASLPVLFHLLFAVFYRAGTKNKYCRLFVWYYCIAGWVYEVLYLGWLLRVLFVWRDNSARILYLLKMRPLYALLFAAGYVAVGLVVLLAVKKKYIYENYHDAKQTFYYGGDTE